ncbi:cation-translocating P-type ATPase [Spiribacter halobius]|uniref:cation-translocating P-type ATPase n=1 Tax=Sediminicurvatus halobius TaxID=2182432 RepID=UPI0018EEB0CA|nr:HAD-IC family P-type ATPase [Spiribacter halobius]UEX79177.1 HAD-IC family P-type ATPase [Spiribacter halobius]
MQPSTGTPQNAPDTTKAANGADRQWWALSPDDLCQRLSVVPDEGLGEAEVRRRRTAYGHNRLRQINRRSPLRILLRQFESVVILVLFAAGALALTLGHLAEGIAVFAVVLVNTAIGFISEWRAVRSMEALQRLRRRRTRVRRDGRERDVSVEALVPGDVILLTEGDLVPADLRLIDVEGLQANEASLTGESVPVDKQTGAVARDTPLAERHGMLYKGTTVTQGAGTGIAVATGMGTELGRIAELAEQATQQATPLEQRLNRLGQRLAWIVIGVAAVVGGSGLAAGRDPVLMIETAIALGVAAIPEGLPIVSTLALARGMWLMAGHQALVNRLSAVETLGATQVIFTDKTGTLTENRMTLRRLVTASGDHCVAGAEAGTSEADEPTPEAPEGIAAADPLARRLVEIGTLCSNAALAEDSDDGKPRGDPTELALLEAGTGMGLRRPEVLAEHTELREIAFDPDVMMMATYHQGEGQVEVAVKGAPAAVLDACDRVATDSGEVPLDDAGREAWHARIDALARGGLRLLMMADKTVDDADAPAFTGLRLVGLVGLLDPPRQEVRASIAACRRAGLRVVMVTGDQPATARAIAGQVGIAEDAELQVMHGSDLRPLEEMSEAEQEQVTRTQVFARVTPEQKLRLVEIFQHRGEVVAMTGDGVNDAPALKKADIGVAMGRRGTDAAQQVADIILQDDRFPSIVAAVEQGRVIFGNIRKAVMFMLCTNFAEVVSVALATVLGAPLPLRPLQILYLNVLTDVFPALALGVGRGPASIMDQPPRDPEEPVLTRRHWLAITAWSLLIAACILGALFVALAYLGLSETGAVTVSFLTLGFTKLWFVFNLRERGSRLLHNEVLGNPWIWAAIALCAALLAAALYVPGLSAVLETERLPLAGWGLLLAVSLVPLLIGQMLLAPAGRRATPTRSQRQSNP